MVSWDAEGDRRRVRGETADRGHYSECAGESKRCPGESFLIFFSLPLDSDSARRYPWRLDFKPEGNFLPSFHATDDCGCLPETVRITLAFSPRFLPGTSGE